MACAVSIHELTRGSLLGKRASGNTVKRLSEKGAQRCRVTNRRQPAGQEQALSSPFVGSRGTVLVSIETFRRSLSAVCEYGLLSKMFQNPFWGQPCTIPT